MKQREREREPILICLNEHDIKMNNNGDDNIITTTATIIIIVIIIK